METELIELILFFIVLAVIIIFFLKRMQKLKDEANILYNKKEELQELFENSEELNKQLVQKSLTEKESNDAVIVKMNYDIHHCINGIMSATTLLKDTYLNADQLKLTDAIINSSKKLVNSVKENYNAEAAENKADASIEAAAEDEKVEISAEFAKKHPLKILLADDDLLNQQLSVRLLKKIGYTVDVVSNGKEALEVVSEKNYDVILMDVLMPEMDGFEATKMIRLCLEIQPIIIALTASAMAGDKDKCIAAGMDDYLSKPIVIEELAKLFRKWNRGKKSCILISLLNAHDAACINRIRSYKEAAAD